MKKKDFYIYFKDEMKDTMDPLTIPSLDTFNSVWNKEFSNLKIPRYNTLGACDTCVFLKTKKGEFKHGTKEHSNVQAKLSKHLLQVREERVAQIARDQSARLMPNMTWTITTDFMQDLYLPWLATRPKSW